MADTAGAASASRRWRQRPDGRGVFAAIDLGTNNCRLLIAEPARHGFRVVGSFSRVVRLGEGVSQTGRLSEAAMARTVDALKVCAAKLSAHPDIIMRAIATQACRTGVNGAAFLERVRDETGITFEVVSAEEEARLAARGCAALFDPDAEIALVVDIGGGSTELCWVDARDTEARRLHAWVSLPVGVVALAEAFPENAVDRLAWYEDMRAQTRALIEGFKGAEALRPVFAAGKAHLVGTSGAVSSLAGLHLNLARYQRSRVDGLWMSRAEVARAAERVVAMDREARAANACIGEERADLIGPGAAIFEAVCDAWPSARVRVADRGLREGVLLELMQGAQR